MPSFSFLGRVAARSEWGENKVAVPAKAEADKKSRLFMFLLFMLLMLYFFGFAQ
jgi:hypothetical protein